LETTVATLLFTTLVKRLSWNIRREFSEQSYLILQFDETEGLREAADIRASKKFRELF